jgi:5-formyltetrahydrofolate cyclo-ligase
MTASPATPSKAQLRAELGARRAALSIEERDRASRAVADNLVGRVDWASTESLHIYAAVTAWRELDTSRIVGHVRDRWPQIEIVSPTTEPDQPLPDRSFDLIIVPVLGFDDENFRLGLGAGFYDRFLAAQPGATTIGLAYRWARVAEGLPREPHDVPLDAIVTDEEPVPGRRVAPAP